MTIRTRLGCSLALCAVLGACGGGPGEPAGGDSSLEATAPAGALLAIEGENGGDLYWASPDTLRPIDRRRLRLPIVVATSARSPNGNAIALASNSTPEVEIVDLGRLREVRTIELASQAPAIALAWPSPDRLIVLFDGTPAFAVVDPTGDEPAAVEPLDGAILQTAVTPDGLAVLLGPPNRIGAARLALVSPDGARTVELSDVRAGRIGGVESEDYRMRTNVPALAVAPSGDRALVVPPAGPVAEVDLETLAVEMHDVGEPASLLDRLRAWLEPIAEAKLIEGPERDAVWLESGLVAVSGYDYRLEGDRVRADPAGAYLLDPGRWTRRELDGEANAVADAGGALLAVRWPEADEPATVTAYRDDGRPRFRLERRGSYPQAAAGRLLFGTYATNRYEIVDAATGKTIRRVRLEQPVWLVESDL